MKLYKIENHWLKEFRFILLHHKEIDQEQSLEK
jgi:hypothetical protein